MFKYYVAGYGKLIKHLFNAQRRHFLEPNIQTIYALKNPISLRVRKQYNEVVYKNWGYKQLYYINYKWYAQFLILKYYVAEYGKISLFFKHLFTAQRRHL